MTAPKSDLQQAYDRHYAQNNYFGYRAWVYRPYLRALALKAGLRPGARVLDAGCGQGLFTALFSDLGFDAIGVDLSDEGIRAARRAFPASLYQAADVRELGSLGMFDCVFTRSCSLYNNDLFADLTSVTDLLMNYVRPGGVFIFDYYSRLGPRHRSATWCYHSLAAVTQHFSGHPSAEVYFSLRLEAILLGRLAFSRPVTSVGSLISRHSTLGGELIAIVRKDPESSGESGGAARPFI